MQKWGENGDEVIGRTFSLLNLAVGDSEERNKGENPFYEIIKDDDVEFFKDELEKLGYGSSGSVELSPLETNSMLFKERWISLINYAAFFGKSNIFNYLKGENEITSDFSMWKYAIHGENPEIFCFLESGLKENENEEDENEKDENEKEIKKFWFELLKIAIKCHCNEIVNYILNNKLSIGDGIGGLNFDNDLLTILCLKYYNFAFISDDFSKGAVKYLVKYNYGDILLFLFKVRNIKISGRFNELFDCCPSLQILGYLINRWCDGK